MEISNKPARTKPIPKKRKSMPASKRDEEVNVSILINKFLESLHGEYNILV